MTRGVALGKYDCELCSHSHGSCKGSEGNPGQIIYCKVQRCNIKRRSSPKKEWYGRIG